VDRLVVAQTRGDPHLGQRGVERLAQFDVMTAKARQKPRVRVEQDLAEMDVGGVQQDDLIVPRSVHGRMMQSGVAAVANARAER
jgi:hypothetical protein